MSVARLAKGALKIPKRIERGPTDILKALNSTVKYDPSFPSSSLIDDPFLLPSKQREERFMQLAKLSGVTAAQFFLNKHPELFYRDDSEPKIEAFLPKEEFTSDMEFSEEDIKWCIEHQDPVNGILSYRKLKDKGTKLSDETMLQFFELICFTNEAEPKDSVEQSQHILLASRELVEQVWISNGLATEMFNEIKEKLDPSRVYSTMIAGLSKHNEFLTASQIYQDFKSNHPNKALYVQAYEGLIKSVPRNNNTVFGAKDALKDVLEHMQDNLVMPTLGIFNAILDCYTSYDCDDQTCQESLKILNDMTCLGIQPSLTTFASVLKVLCKYRNGRPHRDKIEQLIGNIESKPSILKIQNEDDFNALARMMQSITNYVHDLKLAKNLLNIYISQPNLLKFAQDKHTFLNKLFRLMITTDTLENTIEFYDKFVPKVFQPDLGCFDILTDILDLYKAPESFIKRVGKDVLAIGIAERLKKDDIYRRDPEYVQELERKMNKT